MECVGALSWEGKATIRSASLNAPSILCRTIDPWNQVRIGSGIVFSCGLREACRQLASDLLGRRTQDRAVTLGSGVDGAVRRIETAFNKRGNVERITSFDSATAGSGNVVNEVFVLYNGFGQAIDTFQSHAGAVNLSTTPSV